jgi:hypothetical protein
LFAAGPAGPSDGLAVVATFAGVEMLAAESFAEVVAPFAELALGAVGVPRGSRAAEADRPTGRTATATTPARMPRVALFRRNLVMSGDPLLVVQQLIA